MKDSGVDKGRRRFLVAIGGVGALWAGAAAVFPIFKFLNYKVDGNVFGKEGKAVVDKVLPIDVANPGSGKNGGYGGRGLIVLRDAKGELKAFDAKCSHAGCNVGYAGDKLYCPCHGGVYDFAGKNVAGPPPRPLTELKVFVEGDRLFVSPMPKA
jgi:cytochrome b6-f complex iron-sulfur subunit